MTPEEHFLAHQLLVKIYPKETGLIYAAIMMTTGGNGRRYNNKLFGWLRRSISQARKGYVPSEEMRAKLRAHNLGRKHTDETKRKISETSSARIFTQESRIKRSESLKAMKGTQAGTDRSKKISEALRGKPKSPEAIAKRQETRKINRQQKLAQLANS